MTRGVKFFEPNLTSEHTEKQAISPLCAWLEVFSSNLQLNIHKSRKTSTLTFITTLQ